MFRYFLCGFAACAHCAARRPACGAHIRGLRARPGFPSNSPPSNCCCACWAHCTPPAHATLAWCASWVAKVGHAPHGGLRVSQEIRRIWPGPSDDVIQDEVHALVHGLHRLHAVVQHLDHLGGHAHCNRGWGGKEGAFEDERGNGAWRGIEGMPAVQHLDHLGRHAHCGRGREYGQDVEIEWGKPVICLIRRLDQLG